jgi:dTDP-4-amino-4,6-dideoxygalactose transaminase
LTTSCTHALELCALLLDLSGGDEVILPSFTFPSTANAFVLRGARPVFIDCRSDTLNIDERLIEAAITPRTRAIVVVHYAGVGCEMEAIMAIAQRHHVAVVEDNAHGLFGGFRGRPLGSFGALSTLSFHESKNFTCGEGGALVINDERYAARAEILREKGTNRSQFFRGEVDKYTWLDIGSSYLPSDALAAYLAAQLECAAIVQARRQRAWERYHSELVRWAGERGIVRPTVPEHCDPSWHIYYLLLPDLDSRQRLIRHLRSHDVGAAFHYLPLHRSPAGLASAGEPLSLPVTESITDRLLRLPLYSDITDDDVDLVLSALHTWR